MTEAGGGRGPDHGRAPWAVNAAAALAAFGSPRHGNRTRLLETLAAELSVNPYVLRRSIVALEFLAEVRSDPRFARLALESVSLEGVEHVRRWFTYDPEGAAAGARRLADGAPAKELARLESAARRHAPNRLRRDARGELVRQVNDELTRRCPGFELRRRKRERYTPHLEYGLFKASDDVVVANADIVNPVTTAKAFRDGVTRYGFYLMGVAAVARRLVVVVPDQEMSAEIVFWLLKASYDPRSIFILDEPVAGRLPGEPSREQVYAALGNWLGAG